MCKCLFCQLARKQDEIAEYCVRQRNGLVGLSLPELATIRTTLEARESEARQAAHSLRLNAQRVKHNADCDIC